MIRVEDVILVLLAAGKSERFGDVGSKLDEEFLGKPLGLHVAVALEDMPFKRRIAIVRTCRLDYSHYDFQVLHNDDSSGDMASSVKIGVRAAKEQGAEAVLLALADMPRLTAAHIYRMLEVATDTSCVIASSDGKKPSPPALFGRERFDFLLQLEGDQGARDLVAAGRHVITSPAELIDVDTPEELERLRELIRSPAAITRAEARRSD